MYERGIRYQRFPKSVSQGIPSLVALSRIEYSEYSGISSSKRFPRKKRSPSKVQGIMYTWQLVRTYHIIYNGTHNMRAQNRHYIPKFQERKKKA